MAKARADEREREEAAAIRLFLVRVADVRGEPMRPRGGEDDRHVRAIVRLLRASKAGVLLAASRADHETPAETLAALQALERFEPTAPAVRGALDAANRERRAGRLARAERLLERVIAKAGPDLFAEAEALRCLGAVYRAEGRLDEALALRERALGLHETLSDRAHVAIAWGDVGTSLASVGRLRDARTFHERAIAVHRELGRRADEAVEWSYLGVALHRAGRFVDARRAHERAIELHLEAKNRRSEAADHMHLGYVLHQLGELEAARAELDAALAAFRRLGERSLEGVTLSYAGALAVEARRPEDAGPLLRQALVVHREVGSPRHEAVTRIHLAEHHAALDERSAARAEAKRALALTRAGKERTTIELEHRAWALALDGRVDEAAAIALEDETTAHAVSLLRLATGVARGDDSVEQGRALANETRGTPRMPAGSRVRFALERLETSLRDRLPKLGVSLDGARFADERGRRIELGRRAPLVNVLRHLLERRLVAPGVASPMSELLAAGWPGERVLHGPGQLRVRNAVAQLRKLGLRRAIVNGGGGWLLDPALALDTGI